MVSERSIVSSCWPRRTVDLYFFSTNLDFYCTLMPPHCLVQGTGSLLCRKTTNAIMSCEKYTILSPREVAERLVGADNEILLVDCRSLVAFNVRHIKGAIHINCSGILRKRLTQGKAKLKDLISSAEGKERFASDCAQRTLVVYDELSSGHGCGECGPCRPICLVQETLLKEGRAISVLKGEWNISLFMLGFQRLLSFSQQKASRILPLPQGFSFGSDV